MSKFSYTVFSSSPVIRAFKNGQALLDTRDKKLLILGLFVQFLLSILDLFGIGLVGVVATIAVSIIRGSETPLVIDNIMRIFAIDDLSKYNQVIILSVSTLILFVAKTFFSAILLRKLLYFLANRDLFASKNLLGIFFSRGISAISKKTTQEGIFSLTNGVTSAVTRFFSQVFILASEITLLFIIFSGLLFVNYRVSVLSLIYFGVVFSLLHRYQANAIALNAERVVNASMTQNSQVQNLIESYREIFVLGRFSFFFDKYSKIRSEVTRRQAQSFFLSQISRYVFELALIIGAFVLAVTQFLLHSALVATATLTVFLAAGLRILPSILRIQTGVAALKSFAISSRLTYEIFENSKNDLSRKLNDIEARKSVQFSESSDWTISISELCFQYKENSKKLFNDFSLEIPFGCTVGISGLSGSGKSTLVDLILGIIGPTKGTVEIGGVPSREFVLSNPGKLAYVPQNTFLLQTSLEENLLFGLDKDTVDPKWFSHVVKATRLESLWKEVARENGQENSLIGEGARQVSGGQKQRIAIARALLARPRILVLDEATSALDRDTEMEILECLSGLDFEHTRILVSHRENLISSSKIRLELDKSSIKVLKIIN